MMRMPFGRHKGVALDALPLKYLKWLANLDDLREPLASAVYAEMDRREGRHSEPRNERPRQLPQPEVFAEIINTGFRTLANKYHPDRDGGDPEKMVQLNRAVEFLRQVHL